MARIPSGPMQPGRVDDHLATVDRWMARAVTTRGSTRALLEAFQAALVALCQRAVMTLGPVATIAIRDRVIQHAIVRHPFFAAVPSATGELRCEDIEVVTTLGDVPFAELSAGVRTVLVELLSVLGTLTAEILTPELQAELSPGHRAETR